MNDIIESPVIKLVFCEHLWVWSLVLGVIIGGGFEGDNIAVSIFVYEVGGITFFSGIGILEYIYF